MVDIGDYRLVFSIPYDDLPYLNNALENVLNRVLCVNADGSISQAYSRDSYSDANHLAWYAYDVQHCTENNLYTFIYLMLKYEILGVPIRLHEVCLITEDNVAKKIWEAPKESDIRKSQRDCVRDALRDMFQPVFYVDNPFDAVIFEKENHEH